MKEHHLIVIDGETLSQYPWNGIVVNLAASHHVIDTSKPLDLTTDIPAFDDLVDRSFMVKLDLREQMQMGRSSTDSCMDWWKTLPQSVQDQVKPRPHDMGVEDAIDSYVDWLKEQGIEHGDKNVSVWSRGQDFDPILIRSLLYDIHGPDKCDTILPYQYARQRDIRTWVAAAFSDPGKVWMPLKIDGFKHHDAIHDVARSMIEVIVCLGLIQGNDVPDIVGK